MTSRDEKNTQSWRMSLTGCLVLTLACALHDARAQADPHRSVTSDGVIVESTGMGQRIYSEKAYRGTGHPTEFTPIESAEEFADMAALPDPREDGLESIIPPCDDRVRTNPTTTFPARAVVLVTFDGGRCTGWLYGKDIVATAGICVHAGPGGTWRRNVVVYPGRNGTLSPYGSCTAKRLHSVVGWVDYGDEQFDYGAIKLRCSVGLTTGWFGFFWQSGSLTGIPTTISGYPGDKPLTQWRSFDRVRITQTRQIFYRNDTVPGNSGSPVYYNRPGCGFCAMGIHGYRPHGEVPPHSTNNHGARIVQPVFENLLTWRDTP